jgi:hypothetical protein
MFGSSPISLMAKELEYIKWQLIPGVGKESQIACNPEARISLRPGRGCSVISPETSFPAPASLCGRQGGRLSQGISRRGLRRNLPFLPDPCQALAKNLLNETENDPNF